MPATWYKIYCVFLTNQTTLLQERLNTGLASTERLIHLHTVAGSAFFKNFAAELACRFGIKQIAGLHKSLKSIGIQNTGPNVAVVAGRITAGENVLEVGRTVTEINFIHHVEFLLNTLLKLCHIKGLIFFKGMVLHIQKGRSHKFNGGKTLSKIGTLFNALNQSIGNYFTGLIMLGKLLQHLGVLGPILHNLRRQLYKITLHRCP